MIVRFTGLEVEAKDLLDSRVVKGVINPAWERIAFTIEFYDEKIAEDKIEKWLSDNINYKFAISLVPTKYKVFYVVVAFEDTSDAVMFRLKDGHTAWKPETISI